MLFFLFFAIHAYAALYANVSQLPQHSFDFVIVGAGAAGPVVANRLSENPNFTVLLLEAGGSTAGLVNYSVPIFTVYLRDPSPLNWNYTLAPQPGLDNRTIPHPSAKVLGGNTAHNGMAYQRGSIDDYNRYANITGDPGWSWNAIQSYIQKIEQWTPPADNHNTTGEYDPSIHGYHGAISISLSSTPISITPMVLKAAKELGDAYRFNLDTNSGDELGIGYPQWTIRHGNRDDSATAYLSPSVLSRPNLHVLIHAQVTRLSSGPGGPFSTVEFGDNEDAPRHSVVATKEVVLSAGAIETPHIMLLSGIGDSDELKSFGITPRVHLPDVGKNLSVHVQLPTSYYFNSTRTYDDVYRNATVRNALLEEWERTRGGGPLGDGGTFKSMAVFLRVSTDGFLDPSAGPRSAHLAQSVDNAMDTENTPPTGNFITVDDQLVTPASRGSITLNTTNPFTTPIINPNCLSTDFDIYALRQGLKNVRLFLSAPAFKGLVLQPFNPGFANATTDEELDSYIRANANPNWHTAGTASMSPLGAKYGVLDPDLRVKGVEGLRVVDASVIPYLPASTTMFVTYLVGERGADLIKAKWV